MLDWAASSGAWIIEDDYLGELQLQGSPALRLGFVVAPIDLANAFSEVVATLAPALRLYAPTALTHRNPAYAY
jgi:GntR family transcriptional regulator / MocR family aminotransferase